MYSLSLCASVILSLCVGGFDKRDLMAQFNIYMYIYWNTAEAGSLNILLNYAYYKLHNDICIRSRAVLTPKISALLLPKC